MTHRCDSIVTERLTLRPFRESDLENLYGMLSDPEVMRHYLGTRDREGAQKWLDSLRASYERFGYSFFAVERRENGCFVGQVGLLHWDDVDGREDIEVGYMLRRDQWGFGYAHEAARACRDWAFEHLSVDRVVSFIAVANDRSIAVAERNGMTLLKRLDKNRFGQPIYVYGIDRETWAASSATVA